MKHKSFTHSSVMPVVGTILLVSWLMLVPVNAQDGGPLDAVVAAVEGQVGVFQGGDTERINLSRGTPVHVWDTVSTDTQSKALLKWGSGQVASMGESSSILLSTVDDGRGPVLSVQVTEGLVRFADDARGKTHPYLVNTPVGAVRPEDTDQPADFIVETYSGKTAVITVLSGSVLVSEAGAPTRQTRVPACSSAYIEQGKQGIDIVKTPPDGLAGLIDASTIPGTLSASLDACGAVAAGPPPPPVGGPAYYPPPDYYVEEWDDYDCCPYTDLTILPPPSPGAPCIVIIPGIGQFIIPIAVYEGWVWDPGVVQLYVTQVFLENSALYHHDYLHKLRRRQGELRRVMYLAQLAGNNNLLWQARRELDSLRVGTDWTNRRIQRLDKRVTELQSKERNLSGKLPRGLNLYKAVNDSLNSAANIKTVQRFHGNLTENMELNNRLANVAGNEMAGMRSRIAKERDPQKRVAMLNELGQVRKTVAEGKLPVPKDQKGIRDEVQRLVKEQNPQKQVEIQKQLLSQIKPQGTGGSFGGVAPEELNVLKRQISEFPNREKRQDLEKQFTALEQSAATDKREEAERHKLDDLLSRAAKEQNPEKRQDLLGQMKQLQVPLAVGAAGAAGAAGMLHMYQQRRDLEKKLSTEQDAQKRSAIQRNLEDIRKKQVETWQKQPERPVQGPPTAVQQPDLLKQKEKDAQAEMLRKRQEENARLQQSEQLKKKQEEQDRAAADLKRREKEDLERKARQQVQPQQEDLKKQKEKDAQPKLRQQQLEEQRKLQEQADLKRRENQRLEDQMKKQKDQAHQDQLRRQEDEARKQQQQQQQEQSRKQQQQQQQEQSRKVQQQQQEEQSRKLQQQQQDQARKQQLQQQQEQSRKVQQQQQQEQSRKLQQQQQDQARKQQLQQQQEQSRKVQQQQQQEQSRKLQQQQQEQGRQQQLKRLQEAIPQRPAPAPAPKPQQQPGQGPKLPQQLLNQLR